MVRELGKEVNGIKEEERADDGGASDFLKPVSRFNPTLKRQRSFYSGVTEGRRHWVCVHVNTRPCAC